MAWNDRYVTDVSYTKGYYAELSPDRIDTALLCAGYQGIPAGPCCELGYGQGVSLVLHAAASPHRAFHGTDFNPEHCVHAGALANGLVKNLQVCDDPFDRFSARTDLPQFAFIALHGIWSWVSEENRQILLRFIDRHLMPGGVLYLSYNVEAGWIGVAPLRALLRQHAQRLQAPGLRSIDKLTGSLEFVRSVIEHDPILLAQWPNLKKRFDELQKQDPRYVAHEYLNADWHLTSFHDVAADLQGQRLTYVGSALIRDQLDALQLTESQRALLDGIADPTLRESTRDFLTAQGFRRDLWVKGATPLTPSEQREAWHNLRVLPMSRSSHDPIKVSGARSSAALPQAITGPMLEQLHAAVAPVRVADLAKAIRTSPEDRLFRDVLRMSLASGQLEVARAAAPAAAALGVTASLNRSILERAVKESGACHLISPVTGTAVEQTSLASMFLLEVMKSGKNPSQLCEAVARLILARGHEVNFNGKRTRELSEATEAMLPVGQELDQILPVLRRAQIV